MTEEQEQQLRVILEIEGFSPEQIERQVSFCKRRPDYLGSFLTQWKLVTETKQ